MSVRGRTHVARGQCVPTRRARTHARVLRALSRTRTRTPGVSLLSHARRTRTVPATQCATRRTDACVRSLTSATTVDVSSPLGARKQVKHL